jgi:hypothetical protein
LGFLATVAKEFAPGLWLRGSGRYSFQSPGIPHHNPSTLDKGEMALSPEGIIGRAAVLHLVITLREPECFFLIAGEDFPATLPLNVSGKAGDWFRTSNERTKNRAFGSWRWPNDGLRWPLAVGEEAEDNT